MKTRTPLLAYPFVCLLVLFGCDIVNEDTPPADIHTTLYAFAGQPALINTSSFSSGLDLRAIGEASGRYGNIQPLMGGKYLLYTPDASFAGNQDDLVVNLEKAGRVNITVRSLDNGAPDCSGVSGIYDYASIKQGTTLEIDLLDNDIFCDVGYNGGLIGGVTLEGVGDDDYLLSLGPGRSAKFIYTPAPGFTGKLKVIYNLGINWIYGSGFGDRTHEEILANPKKYLEAFTTSMIEVDVTN